MKSVINSVEGFLFLPELILFAQVMQTATNGVNKARNISDTHSQKGKILIVTVEGDVHDIGKTIVVSLFKANGFEVLDLGRDVATDKIIEEAVSFDADIIGTSALLATTMARQKSLEQNLKKSGLKKRFKAMVGSAPCTQRWADRIGSDAYAQDAADGVRKAAALLGT